jgi:ribosomal protein S24E
MTARERRTAHIYDDKQQLATIEPMDDGRWRLIRNGREVGIYAKREQALAAIDDQGGAR